MSGGNMNEIDQFRTGRKEHKPTIKNAILEDICSFDIFVSTEYSEPTPVYCNLEFGQVIENLNGQTFEIGISFAILRVVTSGYVVHSDGKFGEVGINNNVRLDVDTGASKEKTDAKSSSLTANLTGGFNQSKESKSGQTSNISASFNHQFVTAIANDCWTIRSPDKLNLFLAGALISSKVLCSISPTGVVNQKKLGGRIEVPPGQLKMKPIGQQRSKLKHHQLIQTLIYKRMKESTAQYIQIDEDTTAIPISTVEIEDGDI